LYAGGILDDSGGGKTREGDSEVRTYMLSGKPIMTLAHHIAIGAMRNEDWSEKRLRPIQPNFDGARFTLPRQRLLEMVHAALAGEFVEE
jgi:hypothetical protein